MRRGNNFGPTWGVEEPQDQVSVDAPNDGRQYIRVSGEWVAMPYATNNEVSEGTAENKVVQPSNIGNLLAAMGIRWDEESGSWINDLGDLENGGGFGDGGDLGDQGELP